MRYRINESERVQQVHAVSDLYRRFRKIFDQIIPSDSLGLEYQDHPDWYLPMPTVEESLRDEFFERTDNPVRFLLGHTGIGKSTVLQHMLGGQRSVYRSETQTFVAYISCNPIQILNKEMWGRRIAGYLHDLAESIRTEFRIDKIELDELASFISKDNRGLLYSEKAHINTSMTELLNNLKDHNYRGYVLEYLKLICSRSTKLKRLCIVVDDIEGLDNDIQEFAIKDLIQAHTCLHRIESRTLPLSLNLLIAFRPATYAPLRKELKLSPFTPTMIDFGQPVDLHALFKKRFDSVAKKISQQDPQFAQSYRKEDWLRAAEVCFAISSELSGQFGQYIVGLANANVRKALEYFVNILKNGVWFQKNMNPRAAFWISEEDYYVNSAGVIRAMAMPKTQIYVDHEEIPIHNLLHNSEEAESDLLVSYVLRYLFWSTNMTLNWTSDVQTQVVDLKKVEEAANKLFAPNGKAFDFGPTFDWMCESGLLWKLEKNDPNSLVSPTPRAWKTWDLLQENAILLQCFREDSFRSDPSLDTRTPTMKLAPADLFLDCIHFVQEVADVERKHIDFVVLRESVPLMHRTFGRTKLLSAQLYMGLQTSHRQYFTDISRMLQDLEEPLMKLKQTIDENIRRLQESS